MLEQDDLLEDMGPAVHDLEHTVFVFKGRSVPGSKLAELLGLIEGQSELLSRRAEKVNGKEETAATP